MKAKKKNYAVNIVHCKGMMACAGALWLVLSFCVPSVWAFNFKTGNPDFNVRFDNTVTYSAVARVKSQNEELLADPNADDAERNFDRGLVMNRVDLISELDLIYKKFGVRFSGSAWYDHVYNSDNDHDSPATANQTSVAYNEFTEDTEFWHGRGAPCDAPNELKMLVHHGLNSPSI